MKYCVSILLALSCFSVIAQYPCGTRITQAQLEQLQPFNEWSLSQRTIQNPDTHYIPLKFHVIRYSDGTGGMDTAILPTLLDTLNYYYINARIQFQQCGEVNYINDDRFVSFEGTTEENALTTNDVPRVINIYFADTVTLNDNQVCGYAYLPNGPLEIFINDACTLNGNTIVHEIGHVFSLIHTHGPTDSELTDELVNGSNCDVAGDFICDTPADPNLFGKISPVCNYSGTVLDGNGVAFTPMLDNIMSYADDDCNLDSLTPQQYKRVYNSLFFHDRIDLICPDKSITVNESGFISAYPNPFNEQITVYYKIQSDALVSLVMYDMLGQLMDEIYFENEEKGQLKRYIPFGDTYLRQGIYFITLAVDGETVDAIKIIRYN